MHIWQDRLRIDSAGFFTTGSISYWFCWFLYYRIHFVLILLVSLLQNRFRIDSVGFFTTGSISYWFCPILYYRIDFVLILLVSLLQDPFRIHSVRFFNTDGQTQEAPGKANRRSRKFLYWKADFLLCGRVHFRRRVGGRISRRPSRAEQGQRWRIYTRLPENEARFRRQAQWFINWLPRLPAKFDVNLSTPHAEPGGVILGG